MTMSEGSEAPPFDWGALAPLLVHPVKVQIIEAMHWSGEPLSVPDLIKLFGMRFNHQLVSYHVAKLAEVKAIETVGERPSRGTVEIFYSLA
jgi:hypothetical protein